MVDDAFRRPLVWVEAALRRAVARFLNQEVAGYELKVHHDVARWYQHLRRGDVVLVEGRLRISQLIKYATQSQWSHSALYVGDELLRRGDRLREHALASFGEFADRLLIEALTDEGVVAAPLEKYRGHNVRVCRPSGIDAADLDRVIDSVVADLGKQYDNRNLLDLALIRLSPIKFGPLRTRTIETCLGNCTDLQVICSGMIAKAFHRVGYPILPRIDVDPRDPQIQADPDRVPLTMQHYSQTLPRDFDLSPNFEVIKISAFDVERLAGARSRPRREEVVDLKPSARAGSVGHATGPAKRHGGEDRS